MKKKSSKSGPQGPVSKGGIDARSKKNTAATSYIEGTKTNKSPAIRGLTPEPKNLMPKKKK